MKAPALVKRSHCIEFLNLINTMSEDSLFVELWLHIFENYLKPNDALHLRATSRWMKGLVESFDMDNFWEMWIRFGQGIGHGWCNNGCIKLHRIRFNENVITGRVTSCPTVLEKYSERWTKFHLWQYIKLRKTLQLLEQLKPKSHSIQGKTQHIMNELTSVQRAEAINGINDRDWSGIVSTFGSVNLSMKRKLSSIGEDIYWIKDHILLLQSSNDHTIYFSKGR